MILFCLITTLYVSVLLFLRPMPESLKAKRVSFKEHLMGIKMSLFFGVLILIVFLLTTHFTFLKTDENLFRVLALNNDHSFSNIWWIEIFTHPFVHLNLQHLLTNLVGLGLASLYERRAGSKRFVMVLFVSSMTSSLSIFFYTHTIFVAGISGGVFGLGAAYFTDNHTLTTKEWLKAIVLFVFLMALFSLQEISKTKNASFGVDYFGHVLGALGAILCCRLRRSKSKMEVVKV